jgi:hypothetical protein
MHDSLSKGITSGKPLIYFCVLFRTFPYFFVLFRKKVEKVKKKKKSHLLAAVLDKPTKKVPEK